MFNCRMRIMDLGKFREQIIMDFGKFREQVSRLLEEDHLRYTENWRHRL